MSITVVGIVFTESARAITAEALRAELARPRAAERPTVIDVRPPTRFALSHIPGALNVPASICAERSLPPFGRVVVCGDGIDVATTRKAATALAAKAGITAEILEGGFSRWEALGEAVVGPPSFRRSEPQTIFYDELQRAASSNSALVLIDLRRGKRTAPENPIASSPSGSTSPTPDASPRARYSSGLQTEELATVDVHFSHVADKNGQRRQYLVVDDGSGAAFDAASLLRAQSTRPVELPVAVVNVLSNLAEDDPELVVLDLRPARSSATVELTTRAEAGHLAARTGPPTDLVKLFPGVPVMPLVSGVSDGSKALPDATAVRTLASRNRDQGELHVLIDDGDGRATQLADRLRAAGVRRVRVLAGGEEVLARRGKAGLRKMISR